MTTHLDTPFVRKSFTLPQGFPERLASLQVLTGASSVSEVFRHALTTYEQFVEDLQQGTRLYIRRPDGKETRVDEASLIEPLALNTITASVLFYEGAEERIEKIRLATGAVSAAEVFIKAVTLYNRLALETRAGNTIHLRYKGGDGRDFKFWGWPKRPPGPPPVGPAVTRPKVKELA